MSQTDGSSTDHATVDDRSGRYYETTGTDTSRRRQFGTNRTTNRDDYDDDSLYVRRTDDAKAGSPPYTSVTRDTENHQERARVPPAAGAGGRGGGVGGRPREGDGFYLDAYDSAAVALAYLSAEARELVQLHLHDFMSCIQYINRHPNVLAESQSSFQVAAMAAYNGGDVSLFNRIVDRMLIVHHYQNEKVSLEDFFIYLADLKAVPKTKQYRKYEKDYQRLSELLRNQAAINNQKLDTQSRKGEPARAPQGTLTSAIPLRGPRPDQTLRAGISSYHSPPADDEMAVISQYSTPVSYTNPPRVPQWQGVSNPYSANRDWGDNENFQPGRNHPQGTGEVDDDDEMMVLPHTRQGVTANPVMPYAPSKATSRPYPVNVTENRSTGIRLPNTIDNSADFDDRPRRGGALTLATVRDADLQPGSLVRGTFGRERYESRKQDARNFYKPGRVFRLLWPMLAGRYAPQNDVRVIEDATTGAKYFVKPLWMVVVSNREGYCICCPISTYSNRGLLKPGLTAGQIRAHAVIYSDTENPTILRGEPAMIKQPIRVKMSPGVPPMHFASRVHFGQYHTVQWDVPIMDMGKVVADDRVLLLNYFKGELAPNP